MDQKKIDLLHGKLVGLFQESALDPVDALSFLTLELAILGKLADMPDEGLYAMLDRALKNTCLRFHPIRRLGSEELAEARRLCTAATPGPWKATKGTGVYYIHAESHAHLAKVYAHSGGNEHDADFIALARTLLPRLIDALAEGTP